MRFALVTSEVNYVTKNNTDLLNRVLKAFPINFKALVIIQNISWSLLLKSLGLYAMGCRGLSRNLQKNIFNSFVSDPYRKFKDAGVPVIRTPNINLSETVDKLKALGLDLIINVRTRNIFKAAVLALPRWGCINIHHGLLPENRGTMSDLWAFSEGREVGYSIHWMNAKIDDGELIRVRTLDLKTKNYADIPYISSLVEADDLIEILEVLRTQSGKIETTPNRAEKIRHTKNPTRADVKRMRQQGIQL